ncbi:hypothetical protein STENO_004092 [Stenotrophomonas maltophilia]
MHFGLRHQPGIFIFGGDDDVTHQLRATVQHQIEAPGHSGVQRQPDAVATRYQGTVGQGQARVAAAAQPHAAVLRTHQRAAVDAHPTVVVDHCRPCALAFGAYMGIGQGHLANTPGQHAVGAISGGQHGTVRQMDAATLPCNGANGAVAGRAEQRFTGINARAHKTTGFRVQRMAGNAGGMDLHILQRHRTATIVHANAIVTFAADNTAQEFQYRRVVDSNRGRSSITQQFGFPDICSRSHS